MSSATWVTFALKLVLTPALIGAASLAGRRWGTAISGWLVGLPLTSGPVVFILAITHGAAFAAAVAAGTLAGAISQAVFCVSYSRLARRLAWPIALLASCGAFGVATLALHPLAWPVIPLFGLALLALVAALRLLPTSAKPPGNAGVSPPSWDIPARMALATIFVLALTSAAPLLGPQLTGLLAPFPLYAALLTVFAHRLQGPAQAVQVLRGLLFGLFAFAAFFLTLGLLLDRAGIGPAFAAASAVALAVQGGSLRLIRAPQT